MNTELTLINLAHVLFDIHPSNYDFADNVNAIFDIAMSAAKTDGCQSLVNIGYKITAFVEFGDSIADVGTFQVDYCNIMLTRTYTGKSISEANMVHDDSIFESKLFVESQSVRPDSCRSSLLKQKPTNESRIL